MYKFDEAAGRVIANDTQQSVEAVDQAVMVVARLCASIVEVSKASQLPVTTGQPALAKAGECLGRLISTRESVSQATREMLKLKKRSNLESLAVGCPPDFDFTTTGSATTSVREHA